ncbi:MAG: prolyl oligopeptidase family serine peptidase [Gammaproteobacteria bacterium]|nr:prolyl oligopeptidase family serine peptidase [Gammaproteobacteria bacterium]
MGRKHLLARAASLAFCVSAFAADERTDAPSEPSKTSEPYPLEHWAMRAVISNVAVSPDGNHLALMKIASKDGDPIIEIYDAADLTKEPFRLDADPMEIAGFYWASDRDILFTLRQQVRDKIEGFNQGVYEFRLAVLDVDAKKMRSFAGERATVVNILPSEPNKVIVAVQEGGDDGPAARVRAAYRPLAYYEFDLRRGSRKLIIRGKLALGQVGFDGEGNPWLARGFDEGSREYILYHRKRGASGWTEVHRHHEDSFESFGVVGFDVDNPDDLYVVANNGHDTLGLWSFNVDTRELTALYRRSDVDVWNVFEHSNSWTHPDTVTGLSYGKDRFHREFFDDAEGATYAQLEGVVPHAHRVTITSRSRDGSTLTVSNSGPRDPGTYYLLKDGRIQTVGSQQPLFKSEDLADVEYITYKARDGRTIPAYLTVPHGEPPFPLAVMPHGGPFVPEVVGFDKWAQLLANQGYLVLQPQYRGSRNYGLEFYQAAFVEGGQGGFKMQDDKDDGALHLVKEGLTSRDRIAMFGWSYGGYAALVAASRTPQIYQCVVAGAAVSDPNMQVNYYRFAMRGSQREEQLRMWDDSVSPLDEVEKVNVPMLIVHGSVDQRVPPDHAKKYLKLLDEHDKTYKYLELEGADHFYNTLFYNHQLDFFTAMTDFLANDCGPEGL